MYLTWTGNNGDELVIADPSVSFPEPPLRFVTHEGFGGPNTTSRLFAERIRTERP